MTSESVASACAQRAFRADDGGEQPAAAEDQRHESAADRDRVDVSRRGRPQLRRQERSLLDRDGVNPEHAAGGVQHRDDRGAGDRNPVDDGKRPVASIRLPGSGPDAPRTTDLVAEDGQREHDRQRGELRARGDAEHERRSRDEVMSPARVGDRDLEREDRPQEHRIRDDLRHHESGEDHPRHDDG